MAYVDAALGRKGEAVGYQQRAFALAMERKDAMEQLTRRQTLAIVLVMVAEYDGALEQIEWLLSHPSLLSVGLLKADGIYDSLRNNPRFQALLAKYKR